MPGQEVSRLPCTITNRDLEFHTTFAPSRARISQRRPDRPEGINVSPPQRPQGPPAPARGRMVLLRGLLPINLRSGSMTIWQLPTSFARRKPSHNANASRQPRQRLLLERLESRELLAANLSIQPISWNVIGLDSNDVNAGPNRYLVAARVTNT